MYIMLFIGGASFKILLCISESVDKGLSGINWVVAVVSRPRGRRLVNSPQTSRQEALKAMWDEAATENYGQYNRLEVPHMLLDDVRVGDVVELNTPTAGQTFHVFVYEIAEDEVRYRYGLMGDSVGQCLMSNIVRVVGPDEEGISI